MGDLLFDFALGGYSALFVISGTAKLFEPEQLRAFISKSTGIRPYLTLSLVRAISVTELIIGYCILARVEVAPLVAVAWLIAATAAAFVLRRRSGSANCGCYGVMHGSVVGPRLAIRNFVLSCGLIFLHTKREMMHESSPHTGTVLVVLALLFSLAAMVHHVSHRAGWMDTVRELPSRSQSSLFDAGAG